MAKQLNKPTMAQSFKLMKMIEERYTASGLDDKQFTEVMNKELGLNLCVQSVRVRRDQLGILAHRKMVAASKPKKEPKEGTVLARIAELEKQVAALMDAITAPKKQEQLPLFKK